MKRTYRFVEACGVARFATEAGQVVKVPIFPGILKHPTEAELGELLTDVAVARKYTFEALRKAPWQALREFPRSWLLACLAEATLPPARKRALEFMLVEPSE